MRRVVLVKWVRGSVQVWWLLIVQLTCSAHLLLVNVHFSGCGGVLSWALRTVPVVAHTESRLD